MVRKNDSSPILLSSEQQEELENLCLTNKYGVIDQQHLPSGVPSCLADKCVGAVIAASGYLNGEIIMVDLIRRDGNDIDYEPLMWGYLENSPLPCGIIFHHANFPNRTITLSQESWDVIEASGILSCSIKDILPGDININNTGEIFDFPSVDQMPSGQKAAFELFGKTVKKALEELKDDSEHQLSS